MLAQQRPTSLGLCLQHAGCAGEQGSRQQRQQLCSSAPPRQLAPRRRCEEVVEDASHSPLLLHCFASMLTSRLLSTSLAAQGGGRAAAAAAAALRRLGTAGCTGGSSAAVDFATGAAGVSAWHMQTGQQLAKGHQGGCNRWNAPLTFAAAIPSCRRQDARRGGGADEDSPRPGAGLLCRVSQAMASISYLVLYLHALQGHLPAHPCRTRCWSLTSCRQSAAMATTLWQPSPLLPPALARL